MPDPPALVGFDDFELADLLGVTVISHDPEQLGELAADCITARLAGEGGAVAHSRLATRIVARGSGERPPP